MAIHDVGKYLKSTLVQSIGRLPLMDLEDISSVTSFKDWSLVTKVGDWAVAEIASSQN
jgi:hypothetical protein